MKIHKRIRRRNSSAFTIVELLIVIVVIAILAAITIVAYNGIQDRARASAASSALAGAVKKIKVAQVEADSTDPLTCEKFSIALGVSTTDCTPTVGSTSYQYTQNHNGTGTYCITATVGNKSYKVTGTNSTPTDTACAGHGSGGVSPISNLVLNPRGLSSSNWFSSMGSPITFSRGLTWNSRTDWNRITFGSSAANTGRLYLNLSDLENGQTYTISASVGNDTASAVTFGVDFCDQPGSNFSVAPGEMKRINFTASRAIYDNVYRFIDVSTGAQAASILMTDIMVTKGSNLYNYADGSSSGWLWNGTANNATSTGPPL